MTDYRGARGSNTGDDFHELWATRQAIRLLNGEEDLQALAIEGMRERGRQADSWDGVDCALYFGGRDAVSATSVRIEQLKYSAASPDAPWTVARLAYGKPRGTSIIARLAKAWKEVRALRPGLSPPIAALVTNQPVAHDLVEAVRRASAATLLIPKRPLQPDAADEVRLAYASCLDADEFRDFAASLDLLSSAGSRFALQDRVLQAMAAWTDQEVQGLVLELRRFVRDRMLPENDRVSITRESVMLHALGASDKYALCPCPPEIRRTEQIVNRRTVVDAIQLLCEDSQFLCLHGEGGVGKTTALQQIEAALPLGSVMVTFDCYGGGGYLNPDTLRHRQADVFVQLTNEMAAKLGLPLLLSRHRASDFPRMFMHRLRHSAEALAAANPAALLVVAIDAADNSVTAATERIPPEISFVHDFVRLDGLPRNVRFVVTVRTGRVNDLRLPDQYTLVLLGAFSPDETAENVRRFWAAPDDWIADFHHLSNGTPRVQAYAFDGCLWAPQLALDRLRPGKSLADVFEERFREALVKNGNPRDVTSLCAGLVALPRPVPLRDLAEVLRFSETRVRDICSDLAPGIRLGVATVGFADEDFESFVRDRATSQLPGVRDDAATLLKSRAMIDPYAALHAASMLAVANRFPELLALVEEEPVPRAVHDPIQRREAEVQRLRLALSASRAEGNVARALRFVLIGAEGIRTDKAIRDLLTGNPDLAARFAADTVGRLLLSDPDYRPLHGTLRLHHLVVHAERKDLISYRESLHLIRAWMDARSSVRSEPGDNEDPWPVAPAAVAAYVEATFKLQGSAAALEVLRRWSPRSLHLEVGLSLPSRLVAEGWDAQLEMLLREDLREPVYGLFVMVPLALAGRTVDTEALEQGLLKLCRRLSTRAFYNGRQSGDSLSIRLVDLLLTGCEVLTASDPSRIGVEGILERLLAPEHRRIDGRNVFETDKLDVLFRAYALKECRAGRIPEFGGVFELGPKREPTGLKGKRATAEAERARERHDRELREFGQAVFPSYAAVACALASFWPPDRVADDLKRAAGEFDRNEWRHSAKAAFDDARSRAARHALVLLATDLDPKLVRDVALEIDGSWRKGYRLPDKGVYSRLALRCELHEDLVTELIAAAAATRELRLGAYQKSQTLVDYARLILPLSPEDAAHVFRDAVAAAGELDTEVRGQLIMLERLVQAARGAVLNPRATAELLGDVVADAAVRLEGERHFPWKESMAALAGLDAALALADASRWDAQGTVDLGETLPSVLHAALNSGVISPGQASCLALCVQQDNQVPSVLSASLTRASAICEPNLPTLAEEAARDVLLRPDRTLGPMPELLRTSPGLAGPWVEEVFARQDFEETLQSPTTETSLEHRSRPGTDVLAAHAWSAAALVDGPALADAVRTLQGRACAQRGYLGVGEILARARSSVAFRDRVRHLGAIVWMARDGSEDEAVAALMDTAAAWATPAVQDWCRERLPGVIRDWLPRLARGLAYGKDELTSALTLAGLSNDAKRDLLVGAIQDHVDTLSAEVIFALVAYIGRALPATESADVLDWYVRRLARRVPEEHRERTGCPADLPVTIEEAAARFLMAQMGSPDTRDRWRAAHATRRLARTGERATVEAFVAECGRREEPIFCGPASAFYWLAARLWAVIALDRMSGECPEVAASAGRLLLDTALDDVFPHLLLRAFAHDACEKLVASGVLRPTSSEAARLARVNQPSLPRSQRKNRHPGFSGDRKRRFRFDRMDTLPYWYEPILRFFADLDGERFLDSAERWIVDVWGYDEAAAERTAGRPRRFRLSSDWRLTDHRHGSAPTIEPLDTHLEWHAMWCAAGELLKTAPLADAEAGDWDDLSSRIQRNQLSEPPLWSADLLVPTPLDSRHWSVGRAPLAEWGAAVVEADHRAALLPVERADYVVVDGYERTSSADRSQTVHVSSALVEPETAPALVRALQTMDDSWDYKLPDEEDDQFEVDEAPYRLLGWLRSSQQDQGIDERDPFRGYARYVDTAPGRRVCTSCALSRDLTGAPRWSRGPAEPPMFLYETWGDLENDDDWAAYGVKSVGHRLLANRKQLLEFVRREGLDLVVEVEVTRSGKKSGRYAGEEDTQAPEEKFDRIYRLDSCGGLHIAEGCIGAWTGARPESGS